MVKHEIGHLPFEADITDALKYGEENRITVLCDNALLANTIPQGKIIEMGRYAINVDDDDACKLYTKSIDLLSVENNYFFFCFVFFCLWFFFVRLEFLLQNIAITTKRQSFKRTHLIFSITPAFIDRWFCIQHQRFISLILLQRRISSIIADGFSIKLSLIRQTNPTQNSMSRSKFETATEKSSQQPNHPKMI